IGRSEGGSGMDGCEAPARATERGIDRRQQPGADPELARPPRRETRRYCFGSMKTTELRRPPFARDPADVVARSKASAKSSRSMRTLGRANDAAANETRLCGRRPE